LFKAIFYPLRDYISFLNIFQYISFRSAYAAVTAIIISFIFGPKIIAFLTKIKMGQEIRVDGPQSHLKKSGTPTMGGFLIIISVISSVFLWQDIKSFYSWLVIGAFLAFGFLGFLDDYLKISRKSSEGLRSRFKLIGQILIASTVAILLYFHGSDEFTKLYIPFVKNHILDLGFFMIPVIVFYIVGISNAVNLTDGLDGLATGLVLFATIALSIITYLSGRPDFAEYLNIPFVQGGGELTVFCLALVGACIGFLWFNCYPAQVFMGDTGSLALGGVLGVISIILKKEILFLVIGGVFVMETLSVIIQVYWFKKTGKRVFKMAPIHHHFELKGWAESKVINRFWIIGGMLAILGLSMLKTQ